MTLMVAVFVVVVGGKVGDLTRDNEINCVHVDGNEVKYSVEQ